MDQELEDAAAYALGGRFMCTFCMKWRRTWLQSWKC